MFRALLLILQQYGLQVANLCLLLFLAYKLCTNHLAHIADTLKENGKKLTTISEDIVSLKERVSKVEGFISQ